METIVKQEEESASADVLVRFERAKAIILQAGQIATGFFEQLSSLTVKKKAAHDLVSEADVATENFIRQSLFEQFPEDSFFGEESGFTDALSSHSTGGIWVVDPIDGTQPFLSGLPNWCISIAFVLENQLQFGLIFCPPVNELFCGGRGIPAVVNGRPLAPHSARDLSGGLVSIGFSPRSPHSFLFDSLTRLLELKGMFFRNGSGALSLVYVGAGRLVGHVEPHMHSWDCFAAIAIIRAAGGRVAEFEVMDALRNGTRVVAGSPAVFDQLETLLVLSQK